MIEIKVEGRLFSSQSGLFENFLDCCDWLKQAINLRLVGSNTVVKGKLTNTLVGT